MNIPFEYLNFGDGGNAREISKFYCQHFQYKTNKLPCGKQWITPFPWLIKKFDNPVFDSSLVLTRYNKINDNAIWDYLGGFYWFKNKSDLIMFKLVWGEFLK